jgi:galactokinase
LTRAQLESAASTLEPVVRQRALHVIEEIERVGCFVAALERRDLTAAGALMNASHESLRTLYEVSSDALDTLVLRARAHPACLGARMTGAGFGGCAVALVRADGADDFVRAMPMAFAAHPSGGAGIALE